jgi:hypothetical protein
MKTKIDSKLYSLIGSLSFLAIVIGAFLYMWIGSQSAANGEVAIDADYQVVDIGDTVTVATALVADLTSKAILPVVAPTADNVGKENPFKP